VTDEVQNASDSKRVMMVLVVLFIALVAIWAASSIDSILAADANASVRLLRF